MQINQGKNLYYLFKYYDEINNALEYTSPKLIRILLVFLEHNR